MLLVKIYLCAGAYKRIGQENDSQYPPISSSLAEVHGNDGSSGTLFIFPFVFLVLLKLFMFITFLLLVYGEVTKDVLGQ